MTRIYTASTSNHLLDVPSDYGRSGEFICRPVLANTIAVNNAYFSQNSPLEVQEQAFGNEAHRLYDEYSSNEHVYPINDGHFSQYASQVVKGVRVVNEKAYDLVLFPMRGVRNIAVQASVMSQDNSRFWTFDGTHMSQGYNDERIMRDLRIIFSQPQYQAQQIRIGVVDTAKGGYGCRALSNFLDQIHGNSLAEWTIDFHLFHPRDRDPSVAREVLCEEGLVHKQVNFYPVESLLFEDEPELLGYDVARSGGGTIVQRFQQEGQILQYTSKDGLILYKPAPLDTSLIGIMGNAITNELLTLPGVELKTALVDAPTQSNNVPTS